MIITLNDNEQTLKLRQNSSNTDKEMVIPIISDGQEWTPYFILFAGGNRRQRYDDTSIRVYKIDPNLFGKE